MIRVYLDTSAVGGCCDAEFEQWSNRLVDEITEGRKTAVISDLTLREIELAPADVRAVLDRIPQGSKEYVVLDREAMDLAEQYIQEDIVGRGYLIDAQHIAMATVNRVDVLVSWNFKHVVNYARIRMYNGVNLKQGYSTLDVRSPREVLDENES